MDKEREIILCWFPPAKTYLPSPAMTVLKRVLVANGYKCKIVYWNVILDEIIRKYLFYTTTEKTDEITLLGIFSACIALESQDSESLLKQEIVLQAIKPQYDNNANFSYLDHIKKCVSELKEIVVTTFRDYGFQNALFVGMSMSLFQWVPASVIGKLLKEYCPSSVITIGGIGNAKLAEAYLNNFPFFDLASWGEGEDYMVRLADILSRQSPLQGLPCAYYRQEDSVIRSATNVRCFCNLDDAVNDDFSDFFSAYKGAKDQIMLPIEGGRGCHWNICHFCFLNQGYRFRTKSAAVIVSEIRSLIEKYLVYDFCFLDNDVIGKDKQRFDRLLDLLIQLKADYPKFRVMLAEVITNGIDRNTIAKMHLAGFLHIQIGYESPSDTLLSKIEKKNTLASNLFFIKWASIYHLHVGGMNVLRGLLEEDLEDIAESISNIKFLRFYRNNGLYKHEISSLAINSESRYFDKTDKTTLDEVYTDPLKEMLPADYISKEYRFLVYQYVRKYQSIWWDYFNRIDQHYTDNKFSYELMRTVEGKIMYTEYYNNGAIRVVEFNEDDTHWRILSCCNDNIVSTDEIYRCFKYVDRQIIKTAIRELNSLGLLFVGKSSKQAFSIINTSNISQS